MIESTTTTKDENYAHYLIDNQNSFKSLILQMPYRIHLMSMGLGTTLDIGCGAGRNLKVLNSKSVGIDHNSLLVNACVERKLNAFTTDAFLKNTTKYSAYFDSILISHVAEHMTESEFVNLLQDYRKFLKPNGKIVVICPQEKGYSSDSTHIHFMDFVSLERALTSAGFKVGSRYSFPLPRALGNIFTHNEFVVKAIG